MHKKILLVCTGNTCRSPMAAALLQKILETQGKYCPEIQIASAGLYAYPGSPASPEAVDVMRGYGVDLSTHLSHGVQREELLAAEIVLTMTTGQKAQLVAEFPEVKDKVFVLREFIAEKLKKEAIGEGSDRDRGRDKTNYDLPDPFGQNLEVYRRCAALLNEELEALVRVLDAE